MVPSEAIQAAAAFIRKQTTLQPKVGLVLGSGLSHLVDTVDQATVIPYSTIPHFPSSSVAGHRSELVVGTLAQAPIVALRGRFHFYEGYSMQQVTMPIRVMQALGVETLIVTNAAGGLNAAWNVGDIMLIRDHIFFPGLAGLHPLIGPNDDQLGPRFPAMLHAYDDQLRRVARAAAERTDASVREGVYGMLSGPAYETGAEMHMLRMVGVDVVGMSTAPEVIVARHGGMRVLGISLVTNIAHPEAPPANHEEVLEAGEQAKPLLSAILLEVLEYLAKEQGHGA